MVNNSSKVGGGGDSGGGADSGGLSANLMSTEELRDLFSLRQHTLSDTYDSMCGDDDGGGSGDDGGSGNGEGGCAVSGGEVHKQQACFVISYVCSGLGTATPSFCNSHLPSCTKLANANSSVGNIQHALRTCPARLARQRRRT